MTAGTQSGSRPISGPTIVRATICDTSCRILGWAVTGVQSEPAQSVSCSVKVGGFPTLISAKMLVESKCSLVCSGPDLLANLCNILRFDSIDGGMAKDVVIQRGPIANKKLPHVRTCQENCLFPSAYVRSGSRVAADGAWEISDLLQKARRQYD